MTNAAVERSDSQRSQRSQGNGPRVSFNRDVHVKRIDLNPDRFHSLPSRKKHSPITSGAVAKPVLRSSSDASTKKPAKKPSIFSLFSGRSKGSDVSGTESAAGDLQWKRVGRSRSDVGSSTGGDRTRRDQPAGIRKRNNSETETDSLPGKKKSVPLSPISENPPRQSYFGDTDVTVPAGNIGYTHLADLDQVPSKPPLTATQNVNAGGDIMHGDMHSSQQPAARLPLTKGVTVDGMVKRLSQERFSPAPAHQLLGPTFSYTRPNTNSTNDTNNKIMYAQVMKDIEPMTMSSATARGTSPQRYAFQSAAVAKKPLSPVSPVPFAGKYTERSPSPSVLLRPSSLSPPRRPYDETDAADDYTTGAVDVDERPIVPIIRRVEYQYPEMHALSNRRQLLESRLNSRRLGGSAELLDSPPHAPQLAEQSPRILTHHISHVTTSTPIAAAPAMPLESAALYENQPECPPRRRWRAKSVERGEHAPYIEDCFDEADGELDYGNRRHHQPLGRRQSAAGYTQNVIDLGYIDDIPTDAEMEMQQQQQHAFHQNRFREKYRQEFEPKSLDSQFGEFAVQQPLPPAPQQQQQPHQQRSVSPVLQPVSPTSPSGRGEYRYAEQVHSLRREPKAQRSFDRGDSGIERDYQRKSSSGAPDDFSTGSRTWKSMHTLFAPDDSNIGDLKHRTEQFLRRERQHCERVQAQRHSSVFRERSIDDGSHYDPRLDKYPVASSTYRKFPSPTAVDCNANHTAHSSGRSGSSGASGRRSTEATAAAPTKPRSERKLSGLMGLEKVKQLFTGKKKSTATADKKSKEKSQSVRREDEARHSQQSYQSSQQQHHHQHQSKSSATPPSATSSATGNGLSILREPKFSDIATRRRLSTPKASPLPKRAPIHAKTTATSTLSKSSDGAQTTTSSSLFRPAAAPAAAPRKAAWYKSLERLTSPMKNHHPPSAPPTKRLSQSTSTLHKDSRSIGLHSDAPTRAQQHHYRSGGVSQENLAPSKHLRFFGDTDLDSNPPTLSKGHSMGTLNRKRTPLSSLAAPADDAIRRTSYSAQTLPRKYTTTAETAPMKPARSGRKEFRSSTKHLHNISESASDADEPDRAYKPANGTRHQSSHPAPPTTVDDLRTAMKQRSRSSPVRRANETNGFGAQQTGPFQRKYANPHDATDDAHQFHYRSSSELEQRHLRRSHSPDGAGVEHRKPPTGSSAAGQQYQHHQQQQRMTAARSMNTIDRRSSGQSRDRERAVDSSGTEGDSSQHSVVYLHATTVGAIPQPYVLNSRRTRSRDELSSSSLTGTGTATTLKSKRSKSKLAKPPLQPMTRSVSRSLSVLAPWSPRHIHDGYEIDYAPQNTANQHHQNTLPNKSRKASGHNDRSQPPPPPAPTSARSMGRKYFSQSSDPLSTAATHDRRPTSMLRHYREQDMRRETVSIPSRR